ncbi:hypothetical protein FOA52_005392 [Chlamydomonas sp. UWO 241]|nr:hypothetical protein FOA52_005392 [Chlamydomonas sp. UWO 241]
MLLLLLLLLLLAVCTGLVPPAHLHAAHAGRLHTLHGHRSKGGQGPPLLQAVVSQSRPRKLQSSEIHWAVMIDAGSSGSRVHVFSYDPPAAPHKYAAVRLPDAQLRLSPGLSSFEETRSGDAAASLEPLIAFAKENVPPGQWASTPIHLMATAGLRMLPHAHAESTLASCRRLLSASGFEFRGEWARVLPGSLEGVYAWVAMNYAAGTLQAISDAAHERTSATRRSLRPSPVPVAGPSTWGVFELGGASMQLTFVAAERLPAAAAVTLSHMPGLSTTPLYAHSFLGLGLDTAYVRASQLAAAAGGEGDPCLPVGFTSSTGVKGTGSFSNCSAIASRLLADEAIATECTFRRCSIGGEFMPALSGHQLAVENFHYTVQRLSLPPNASLAEVKLAGTAFCGRDWTALREELVVGRGMEQAHVAKTCFGAAYIYQLLTAGFHIRPNERRLLFSNAVKSPHAEAYEVNWVTGALLAAVIHAPLPGAGASGGDGGGSNDSGGDESGGEGDSSDGAGGE